MTTPTAPEVTRLEPEEELRQKALARFGFAPGWYSCKCTCCRSEYIGDKRSTCCQQCAEAASLAPSEPDKWAQQNPEAWEALRTGRAGVYGDLVLRDKLGFEYTIRERLDKPFKSEAKEGV